MWGEPATYAGDSTIDYFRLHRIVNAIIRMILDLPYSGFMLPRLHLGLLGWLTGKSD